MEYLDFELPLKDLNDQLENCKKLGNQKVVRSERNSKYIIIRRRECYECGHRWETIQYPEMIVSKQQAAYARCE